MISGPFFGKFFDEVVSRMENTTRVVYNCYKNEFENGNAYTMITQKA